MQFTKQKQYKARKTIKQNKLENILPDTDIMQYVYSGKQQQQQQQ